MPLWLFFPGPLGTRIGLETMDFVYLALPFVKVPTKNSTDLATMDYCYHGRSFVGYTRG